jgi:hypothetical protein
VKSEFPFAARSFGSHFIYPQRPLENALHAIGSILEFPDNLVMAIIERRDGGKSMVPARMALLVAGHAAFLAMFVWLFH